MENRKGSGIFLSLIGVATLVVAIIGATFAYFSATARSENEAIATGSTTLALGYKDLVGGLKTNMIPSTQAIAQYAAYNETWKDTSKDVTVKIGQECDDNGQNCKDVTKTMKAPGQCIDQNNNEICSFYEFWVGNPSKTTGMSVTATLQVVTNDFAHLKYAIWDERGITDEDGGTINPVATGTFPLTTENEGKVELTALNQTLIPYSGVDGGAGYNAEDPSTYLSAVDKSLDDNANAETNVRHYTMLIWIDETGEDQTTADAGKMFSAGISFKTGGAGGAGGVTGVIAVADSN